MMQWYQQLIIAFSNLLNFAFITFLLTSLLFSSMTSAAEVNRNEILRYAYLSDAPYFFKTDLELSAVLPRELEILRHLVPENSTKGEAQDTAVQHLEILTTVPTPIVVAVVQKSDSEGVITGDLIFGLRGSSSIGDYLADLALFEIHGKSRINQSLRFNRESLRGIAAPNLLEFCFGCLPDCYRPIASRAEARDGSSLSGEDATTPLIPAISYTQMAFSAATSFTDYVSNMPRSFVNSILKERLIKQYLQPIGTTLNQYLVSPTLRLTLQRLKITKINKIIFVGHSLGGLLARILALNYSNRVAGFSRETRFEDLPDHAESVGFNFPGLNRDDYKKLFHLMNPDKDDATGPFPFRENQHLTIGHKQDLVLAMGNVREREGPAGNELVLEPDGSSFIISLPHEWFDRSNQSAATQRIGSTAAQMRTPRRSICQRFRSCIRWTGENLYNWTTTLVGCSIGVDSRNTRPHDLFELIDSLEQIQTPSLRFSVYPWNENARDFAQASAS
jgi:pimeloyl-ACP methyl ester carboxylesterase